MKFFIDTAQLDEIEEAAAMGVLDGVTTNPSLMKKAGAADFHEHIRKICEMVHGDVSAEVVAVKYNEILAEARDLAPIHENVVVKVPLILDGIKAIRTLTDEGIRDQLHPLLLAHAGAHRREGRGHLHLPLPGPARRHLADGMDLVRSIRIIYDNYGYETEILAASIRHPVHVVEAAEIGADVATMPLDVIKALLKHPLTDSGLEKFLADWDAYQEALQEG
jgi:transaldolase